MGVAHQAILVLIVFLYLALVVAHSALGQNAPQNKPAETTGFQVEVDIDPSRRRATVKETITIQCNGSVDQTIVLQAVPFAGVRFRNASISDGARAESFDLAKNADGLWQAELPYELTSRDTVNFELSYDVIHDGNPIYVPLIFLPFKPTETADDLFSATVRLPDGYRLTESFPTNVSETPTDGNSREYRFTMSVIPSVLKLGLAEIGSRSLDPNTLVDFLVIVVIFAGGAVLWRFRKHLT